MEIGYPNPFTIENWTFNNTQNYEIIMQVYCGLWNHKLAIRSYEQWALSVEHIAILHILMTHEHWTWTSSSKSHPSWYQQNVIQSSMSFLLIVVFVLFWSLFFSPNSTQWQHFQRENQTHNLCIWPAFEMFEIRIIFEKGSSSNWKLICAVCSVHCCRDVLLCCDELMDCGLWTMNYFVILEMFCCKIACDCFSTMFADTYCE